MGCTFNGRLEYYKIKRKKCHEATCLRPADGEATNKAMLVELVVRNTKWFVRIRHHKWDSCRGDVVIRTLQGNWNIATTIDAVAKVARDFGTYNPLVKNCKDFASKLLTYMTDGPSDDVDVPLTKDYYNYWDVGKFVDSTYGIKLFQLPAAANDDIDDRGFTSSTG